ncbi:MAG TPA: hypothetical protein VNB06_04055 [Thermoanaerobaculia bacterium]|nr:hypothetical protein [Thermoanaerobaculia bacterium]
MFHGPIHSTAELQALFRERRSDIETLLRQVGFGGNAQDLFAAVSAGDSIEEMSVARGTRMGWMFFRRRAQATAMTDICWAANESFDAYVIEFESPAATTSAPGTRYRIAVPKVCGNLALLGQEPVARLAASALPLCALEVTDSCDTLQFDIDATGTTAQDISIAIAGPEQRTLGASDAAAPLRWRYSNPEKEGTFRFTLTGRTEGAPQCTDTVTIERDCCPVEGPPSIGLTSSADNIMVGEEVQVQADPRVHECAELRRVTIDGVEVAAPYARNLSWAAPGEYTVVGRVTDDEGQTADASLVIRVRSQRGWTIRPFLAGVRFDDDVTRLTRPGEAAPEFYNYLWESGEGFGVQAEYRMNDRLGIAVGALFADFTTELMWDYLTLWEMDFDDMATKTFFVGPMFHPLRRDSRVDFFVGPVLHYTDIGSVEYVMPSLTVREDFDDQFSFGAQLGLDVPFRRDGRFGLHVGSLWLDLEGEADDFDVSIDPLTFNLGVFYRFR